MMMQSQVYDTASAMSSSLVAMASTAQEWGRETIADLRVERDIPFQEKYPFDQRLAEAERVLSKYPSRIPIIVEPCNNMKHEHRLIMTKKKYLVPNDINVGQFLFIIRKRIKLPPEKALFIFVGSNHLVATSCTMSRAHMDHKNKDQFLYMTVATENTFG
tara:strand:+ start:2298 stop:2777 length:480 start_codon:yes stop_codon:yes gene_type:complete